jgi:hypothetical protein
MAAVADMSEREVEQHLRILRRIVLSALPIIADAGKVDLAELDADYLLDFADQDFPPVTAPPPDGVGEVGFGRVGA